MRVLHFAPSFIPQYGGTTTRLINLLADEANTHYLYVPFPRAIQDNIGDIPCYEDFNNIEVRRLELLKELPFKFLGVNNIRTRINAIRMAKSVRQGDIDIIHGHNPRQCAMASLGFKRRHGLPMVYEAHGIMQDQIYFTRYFGPFEPLNRMRWFLLRKVTAYWEHQVVCAADHLIAQTESARCRLIKLYGLKDKPISVIPNGVDTSGFDPENWKEHRESLRKQHSWQGRIVCLYAGYLDAANGIEFLLNSLPLLTDTLRQRLKIVLIGRGPLRHKVEQAAEEHGHLIDFLGMVQYGQMPAYYAAGDVFMIPRLALAQSETLLPMKLLEAMAMEKLILVSNVAAMAEVITDGQNGLVFEKGNNNAFLSKLEDITACNDKLKDLGRHARRDVLDKYTWDTSRDKLQIIYDKLVQ